MAAIVITAVALTSSTAALVEGTPSLLSANLGPCHDVTTGTLQSLLIIANDTTGYNNSRYQPFVMKVHRCDTLLVTFTDKSCCAPHGLAVETYFPKGIISQPGQSSSMRLQATISGQFALTEHIFSPTYLFDRNSGTLNVT